MESFSKRKHLGQVQKNGWTIQDNFKLTTIMHKLISICVITYNSSKYIEETLDSILHQDYPHIEVLIGDDCSTDNTPDICRNWIEKNKNRFVNCKFVQTPANCGIVGNYNNVWPLAKGDWIKFIAGDDLLKQDCISTFANNTEDDIDIMCCLRENFRNDSDERWITGEEHLRHHDQLRQIIKKHHYGIICGATLFVRKEYLEINGGFDERYVFAEDYPICMKYLLQGKYIKQIEKPLIEYRNYASVSNSGNPIFLRSHTEAMIEFLPKAALYCRLYHYWYHFKLFGLECRYADKHILKRLGLYFLKAFDIVGYKKYLTAN